jgi:hypothetical protein
VSWSGGKLLQFLWDFAIPRKFQGKSQPKLEAFDVAAVSSGHPCQSTVHWQSTNFHPHTMSLCASEQAQIDFDPRDAKIGSPLPKTMAFQEFLHHGAE